MTHIIKATFKGVTYFAETDEGQTLEQAVTLIAGGEVAGNVEGVFHINCGAFEDVSFSAAEAIAASFRNGDVTGEDALDFASRHLNEDLVAEFRSAAE